MKKITFTLLILCLLTGFSNAQSCGNSGPSVCTPIILAKPGLSPVSDSLAPVLDHVATVTTIEFQNYDTLTFSGQALTMDSLTVLQITNLPSGLCWATNKVTNTFGNQENGCIKVTGTTCAAPGQYKLDILVIAYTSIGFPLTTSADAAGLHYYVRVNCDSNSPVFAVDTTQTAADSIILYSAAPYNQPACHACSNGIAPVDQSIQSLSVYPNPFNSQAEITFNSAQAGMMTEKITSVLGSVVYSNQLDVKIGANTHTINRNTLASGVYFFTISDGSSTFTKRVVIE